MGMKTSHEIGTQETEMVYLRGESG